MRRIVLLILPFCVAACSMRAPEFTARVNNATLEQSLGPTAVLPGADLAMPARPIRNAAALPAEAGAFRSVETTEYRDGFDQHVELDHGGRIALTMRDDLGQHEGTPLFKPTEAGIRDEMARRFPNFEMKILQQPRYNAYGVYGAAIGRDASGLRCLFAWQWLDRSSKSLPAEFHGVGSLRIQLCRPDRTVDQLAKYVDQLDIRHSFSFGRRTAASEPAHRLHPGARLRDKQPAAAFATRQPAPDGNMTAGEPRYLAGQVSPGLAPQGNILQTTRAGENPDIAINLPPEAYRGPANVAKPAAATVNRVAYPSY